MKIPRPPSIPQDILNAIGNPTPKPSPSDAQMGAIMKSYAHYEIDQRKITSKEQVFNRIRYYATWFDSIDYLDEKTKMQWMHYEQMFAASCLKYLKELKQLKSKLQTGEHVSK